MFQGDSIMPLHGAWTPVRWEGEIKEMIRALSMLRAGILVVLFVLLTGVSQAVVAQDSQSKGVPEKKDAQSSDASKKASQDAADNRIEKPQVHEFVITNFKTEGGITLPQVKIVYGTYGHLNAARDNVVLLPSHYMADHHGYEFLIGSDRALAFR
jgi:hypothetical protein